MAETLSPHYSWVKPDIGGDASTWGNVLNQTIDAVDSVVWANQQAGLPIGSVSMFAGATAPPNWLICDGSSLPTTGGIYDGLFAAIGYAYGGSDANFNLPNLASKFPLGANPSNPVGQAAGSYSYTLDVAHLPPHNHPASQDVHAHAAWQDAHNHVITTGNHSHGITTGAHNHTIPQSLVSASPGGLTSGGASFSLVGGQVTSTAGNLGGNTDTAGNLGGSTDVRTPGVYTDNRQPNVYVGNTGSGAAMSIVPSYVALNFIIRYK